MILDPITAFLGDTSDQCNTDVWKLLSMLTRLADELKFAVLVLSHLRKKEGAAIHRAMGSLAFVASARTAWTIANDPADAAVACFCLLKTTSPPTSRDWPSRSNQMQRTCAPIIHWLPDTIEARATQSGVQPPAGRSR